MSAVAKRIVPLLDRVLVERAAAAKKSAGGVILPESAVSKLNEGVVKAVGPGTRDSNGQVIPMEVKEGDRVLLAEYGGMKLDTLSSTDDSELYIYRRDDILARLE
mmetsp:Transcript_16586/g.33986  ORF Transcript_16586/g.33986 Transcript_16586/m.33986 type:complete len:105 (-) Transcript_16586:207-521(-)